MRFLDTMSLHISMAGFTSYQRILYNAKKKGLSMTAAAKAKSNSKEMAVSMVSMDTPKATLAFMYVSLILAS